MKVILIEEYRFAELIDLLKAQKLNLMDDARTADRLGWDKAVWRSAVDEAHRCMHFHLVRWAQSHGASCVQR